MSRRCPRCESDNTIKVYSARALAIPEFRKEVEEGLAIVGECGCHGTGNGIEYKCRDCNLQWDELMEEGIRESVQRYK